MKKNLYDLLELSQSASQEAINAAYLRLSSKISGTDPDSVNRKNLLDDAFSTLSQPALRRRYDASLAAVYAPESGSGGSVSFFKLMIITLLIAACGLGYAKYAKDQEYARLERERIAAEARKAALLAEEEREQFRAENERKQEALRVEQQQRRELELARRDATYSAQNQSYAARQVELQQLREQRQVESKQAQEQREAEVRRRQEQNEAQRRLEREKAYLRQLEAENTGRRRFSVR